MAPSYGSLVKEAIVLLNKFSAGRQCLDDFMDDASQELQNMDTLHKKFVLDVVSGCTEHKKLLDIVINVFYGQNVKYLSRGDRSQFVIICYLTTFALDDLGLQSFSNIVKSLDIKMMHTFLTFFFTNLTTWIQQEWNQIYDAAYVEKQWIGPLLRWRPEIEILMNQLAVKMSGGTQIKRVSMKTTEPQEFSLTKPKPQLLPMSELIPQQEKSKPVPNSTYRAPKEMQIIEEIKEKNHQKIEELLYEANTKQFRCVNTQKSERTKKVMSVIKEDFDSKLKFNSFHSSGSPSSNKSNSWPIKLNSAAILRTGALYDRWVEEELQRMERLVEGAREPSSFLQWQKEMREKDLHEELAMIERRRLDGRISYEEAAMARTRIMERNQKTAQQKKEETAQLMRRYAEKRLQEEKEMRDLVQQVAEGHKNSKAAKEKLQKFKQSIVKEVSEQGRELLRQALEDAQAELSRKFEIIHEIRTIESLPHIRVRNFDNTETAGHKLLGEMSLVELKERLALLKEAQQTGQQEKRQHIMEEMQSKKQLLLEQLDTINIHRRALAQAAAIRKEERKARLRFQQAVTQDERVLALQKKLEDKKHERQRIKQTESKKAKTSEPAAAHTLRHTEKHDRKSLKEKSWEELELSLEHQIQKDAPYVVSLTETLKT
ncbi:cilia- and flagella-associated protein 99 [Micropterus dolomieu]|uniref:cilia- and flagella-associated protein 99 n=1 Tax=Micropterus dolomieu TaxID=147949 RepID=UPI001E8E2E61|nr:cilia- and flagella-associated protein 99 [Micropterus dolomieu]XP_045919603.1 cilia- and flagella-associated protein 99 [Micropterus dolomieu]